MEKISIDKNEVDEFRKALPIYLEYINSIVPNKQPSGGEVKQYHLEDPPEIGASYEDILNEFKQFNIEKTDMTNTNSNMVEGALLGDNLSIPLNNPMFAWICSPLSTELEMNVMDKLIQLLNLPDYFLFDKGGAGSINISKIDGLFALFYAAYALKIREYKGNKEIIHKPKKEFIVYIIDEFESDYVERGIDLCGFKAHKLNIDKDTGCIDIQKLIEQVQEHKTQGSDPLFFIMSIPIYLNQLEEISKLCISNNIWLHLDAGVEGNRAFINNNYFEPVSTHNISSISIDASIYAGNDSYLFWTADRINVTNGLSFAYLAEGSAPYLKWNHDEEKAIDYKNVQVFLGKKPKSFKIWMAFNYHGVEGITKIVKDLLDK